MEELKSKIKESLIVGGLKFVELKDGSLLYSDGRKYLHGEYIGSDTEAAARVFGGALTPIKDKETKKEVREFSTGAQRDVDTGKEDYIESVSWLALQRYARYMKTQEKKYPAGNWRKGIPIKEYEKSLMRHLQKYIANKYDNANIEPDIDHLGAAYFNLQGLMHEIEKLNIKP